MIAAEPGSGTSRTGGSFSGVSYRGDMPDPSDNVPGAVGPYRLVQRLGEGGMGVVHLGLGAEGHAVAVKVMRAHIAADPDARRRLAREVETLRRVRHPRVAEVIDADVDGAVPYLVTRFVPGRPLDLHVREHGPLARGHVARVGTVLADALRAIHAAGVVHRDVKPANVMLLDGEPVLIDFGIAHVADETRITVTGLVMGTPGYLSPEVVAGEPVTSATDWWGWGATLAFAATGRPPFGTGPIEVILDRVRRGDCDLSGLDGPLRDALDAALTIDPAKRPSPEELVRGLTGPIARRSGAGAAANGAAPTAAGGWAAAAGEPMTERVPSPAEAPTSLTPAPNEDVTARVPAPWPQPMSAHAAAPPAPAPAAPGAGVPATKRFDPPRGRFGRPARPAPTPPPYLGPPGSGPARPGPGGAGQGGAGQGGHGQGGRGQAAAVRDRPPPPPGIMGRPAPPPQPPAAARPPATGDGYAPWAPGSDAPTDYGRWVLPGVVVTLSAMAVVAPYDTAWLVWFGAVVARVVERSDAALLMRRRMSGPRGSDGMVVALGLPWRTVVAAVMSFAAMILPVMVGVSTAFIVGTAQAGPGNQPVPTEYAPLALGMAALLLTAWWGPGGSSLRRGSRLTVRGLARGPRSRIAVWAVVVLALISALLVASNGGGPDLGPIEDSRLATMLQ
jgi:predicted Ser/Thr protein kinase